MSYLKIILFSLLIGVAGVAQEKPQKSEKPPENLEKAVVLNQVLFSENEQSWTSRDLRLFEKVLSLVLNKKNISPWSEGRNEDFLLSRLSYREAILFGVAAEKAKLTEADRKKIPEFSQKEIEDELGRLNYVLMFVDLKENQLKQKDRFITWLNHLKRKYQVKIKAAEAGIKS